MTFLPIVERELRVAARRKSTYNSRMGAALFAGIFGGYGIFTYSMMGLGGSGGRGLFTMLTGYAFYYCAIVGVRNSCDCISEEKREGTLGLLFLTDLKGFDIVLGKLFATTLKSFYGLLAAVPILGFSLVLGGVSGLEFWRVTLALLNISFFSHAAGVLISTFNLDARKALMSSFCFVALWLILPYKTGIEILSPAHPFEMATNIGLRSNFYWTSLLLTHFIAWGFLLLASVALPRVWQEKAHGVRATRWRERWRQWTYGKTSARNALRKKRLDANAFFWVVCRNRFKPIFIWSLLVLGGGFWIWQWCEQTMRNFPGPFFIGTIVIAHTAMKILFASEASHHFGEQRRSGALETLLACTPLSVADILRGQWLGLRKLFTKPLIVILIADAAMLLVNLRTPDPRGFFFGPGKTEISLAILAAMIMLATDVIALGWVGMWQGLSATKSRQALGGTIGRILFLPWIIFYSAFIAFEIFGFSNVSFQWMLALWFALGIGIDVLFSIWSRRKLHRNFRALAATHREERIGFLGYLGRRLGRAMNRSRRRGNASVPPVIYKI